MYGGNLPENFPVISAFQDGTAILIKSLNHTAPSYQNPAEFHKAVQEMIDALYQFQGADYGGISIGSKDILRRKLILILPENELDPRQEAALMDVMRYSMSRFVEVDLQRYQKV